MEYTIAYDGYGSVYSTPIVHLSPKQAKSLDVTHAALVIPKLEKSTDFDIEVEYSNDEYLRINNPPNTWEVFWLFFNYTIDPATQKKTCNYFLIKPNGCELGTAYDELGQTFIATTEEPKAELRKKYILRVVKSGVRVQVYVDRKLVMDVTDQRLYNVAGDFGFYTEDASVTVYSWKLVKLK
jgi:hypothetical protein